MLILAPSSHSHQLCIPHTIFLGCINIHSSNQIFWIGRVSFRLQRISTHPLCLSSSLLDSQDHHFCLNLLIINSSSVFGRCVKLTHQIVFHVMSCHHYLIYNQLTTNLLSFLQVLNLSFYVFMIIYSDSVHTLWWM